MGWVIGCGAGCAAAGRRSEVGRKTWRTNLSFVDGLARAMPFDDSSVDLVWREHVLQHLTDTQAAIDEIGRVLRPGGRAVLLESDYGTRIVSDLDPDLAAAF
jgi:ubiquinone/menaquinone biosynthesis C-methylase UbiE